MFALLFDLEDYATTYRATRDAYLKAANELKLATGPYKVRFLGQHVLLIRLSLFSFVLFVLHENVVTFLAQTWYHCLTMTLCRLPVTPTSRPPPPTPSPSTSKCEVLVAVSSRGCLSARRFAVALACIGLRRNGRGIQHARSLLN